MSSAILCLCVLASSVLGTVASDAFVRRQTPSGPCAAGVHVIGASGSGADNIGSYGLLGTLVGNITDAIPGSDNVILDYPKGQTNGLLQTTEGVSRQDRSAAAPHPFGGQDHSDTTPAPSGRRSGRLLDKLYLRMSKHKDRPCRLLLRKSIPTLAVTLPSCIWTA